jgi:peptide deformylase
MHKEDPLASPELVQLYVKPHKKISREVTEADIPRVMEDGEKLYRLCHTPVGIYPSGFAVAHPQITEEDCLRFYVTYDEDIIINPVIVNHTKTLVYDLEGCMSEPLTMPMKIGRWYKIVLQYQTIEEREEGVFTLSEVRTVKLKGRDARVAQHECHHLDSVYISDIIGN